MIIFHCHLDYKLLSKLLTSTEKECLLALWCYQYPGFRYNADWKSIATAIDAPDEKAAQDTLWLIHLKLREHGVIIHLPTIHRSSNTSNGSSNTSNESRNTSNVVPTPPEGTPADRYQTGVVKRHDGENGSPTTHSVANGESPGLGLGLGLGGFVGNPGEAVSYHTGPSANVRGPVAGLGGLAAGGNGSTDAHGVFVASPAGSTMGPPPQRRAGSANSAYGPNNGLATPPTNTSHSSAATPSKIPPNTTIIDLDGYDVTPVASRKRPASQISNDTPSSTAPDNNGYNNGHSVAPTQPGISSGVPIASMQADVSPMVSNGYHAAPTGPGTNQAAQYPNAPASGLAEAAHFQQWYAGQGTHHAGPAHGDVSSMLYPYNLQNQHQQPVFIPGYGDHSNPYQQQHQYQQEQHQQEQHQQQPLFWPQIPPYVDDLHRLQPLE